MLSRRHRRSRALLEEACPPGERLLAVETDVLGEAYWGLTTSTLLLLPVQRHGCVRQLPLDHIRAHVKDNASGAHVMLRTPERDVLIATFRSHNSMIVTALRQAARH